MRDAAVGYGSCGIPVLPLHYPLPHPSRQQAAEHAFDRLNPEFGVPADQHNLYGRQAVRNRQAALALGSGSPSTTHGRTNGIPSSGGPARTTG